MRPSFRLSARFADLIFDILCKATNIFKNKREAISAPQTDDELKRFGFKIMLEKRFVTSRIQLSSRTSLSVGP